MPKKKRPSLRKDENEVAYGIVQAMIGEGPRPEPPGKREKNPEAVRRGAKGGKTGGQARADSPTKKRRIAIAQKGGQGPMARAEDSGVGRYPSARFH